MVSEKGPRKNNSVQECTVQYSTARSEVLGESARLAERDCNQGRRVNTAVEASVIDAVYRYVFVVVDLPPCLSDCFRLFSSVLVFRFGSARLLPPGGEIQWRHWCGVHGSRAGRVGARRRGFGASRLVSGKESQEMGHFATQSVTVYNAIFLVK